MRVRPRDRPTDKTAGMRFAPLLLAIVMTACSSTAEPNLRQLNEPSTPTVGRELAIPTPGRAASGPPPRDSRAVHVLGAFEQLPTDTAWADGLPAFDSDVATIATIACELGSSGCTIDLLGNLAAGGVEIINLEPSASRSTTQDLVDGIAEAERIGMVVAGRDLSGEPTTEPVGTAIPIAVLVRAVELGGAVDVQALEQSLDDESGLADAVVVLMTWGDDDGRSPSAEQVSVAEGLIDAGARAVIGSGSVHLQRAERIGFGLVAYDLGNAATQREDPPERDTAILRLVIDSPTESSCLLPATAGPEGPILDNPSALWCG